MARIVHIALKVEDLEGSTAFYEDVLGLRQTGTGHARGHVSRHMTDGITDVALMVYDSEEVHEAQLSGAGPCIHHWGIEVEDRDATVKAILAHGGSIISKPGEGALKFRAPDGTVAEIVGPGRYEKGGTAKGCRIVQLTIEVGDPAAAAGFYQAVFGFEAAAAKGPSRHLTDGAFDLALIAGGRSRLLRWGVEAEDTDGFAAKIAAHGGIVLSQTPTIDFRAPDGTLAAIGKPGAFENPKR